MITGFTVFKILESVRRHSGETMAEKTKPDPARTSEAETTAVGTNRTGRSAARSAATHGTAEGASRQPFEREPAVELEPPGEHEPEAVDTLSSTAEPSDLDLATGRPAPWAVVGIGASAGGLDPLREFFRALPLVTGAAYVVVQHLAPDFRSLMEEILGRVTPLPILNASDGMELEADHVYLIRPGTEVGIAGTQLIVRQRDAEQLLSHPVDTFLRTLANAGPYPVAVILSGSGHDGAQGASAVAENGGHVLYQNPESAEFDAMPRAAAAACPEAEGLLPSDMPDRIVGLRHQRVPVPPEAAPVGGHLRPMLLALGESLDVDFTQYRVATVGRRVERRMLARATDDPERYLALLRSDPEEQQALFEDLLIGVTSFFRDPQVWDCLATDVLPRLVADTPPGQELRAWVVGAASGQEAYTLAMLAAEAFRKAERPPAVRVFATDLHPQSLETATRGIYPVEALAPVPPELRQRYFTIDDDGTAHIRAELRRMVVVSRHDVTRQPPFSQLDLVTCRNMLIYLEPRAQRRVLGLLGFALRRHGALVLGASETVQSLADDFATIDHRLKIFTKRTDGPPRISGLASTWLPSRPLRAVEAAAPTRSVEPWLLRAYNAVLGQWLPDALLVDGAGNIAHVLGQASRFLTAPSGRATTAVDALVRPELRTAVATTVQRATRTGSASSSDGHVVPLPTGEVVVDVEARPLRSPGHEVDGAIVVLRERGRTTPSESVTAARGAGQPTTDLRLLEEELERAREQVQATVEELETSNEELQATNEELMSTNEELQSSNEELQSVNEELYTVNREYEDTIEELSALTTDLDNIMRCTELGVVVVDARLRIRRFTPAATRYVNVLRSDVGRPLMHLSLLGEPGDLEAELQAVLREGNHHELNFRRADGSLHLLRLDPYLRDSGSADGVVLTWVDIDQLGRSDGVTSDRAERMQRHAEELVGAFREPTRALLGFVDLLDRSARGQLSEATAGHLAEVREASSVLGRVLDIGDELTAVADRPLDAQLCSLLDVVETATIRATRHAGTLDVSVRSTGTCDVLGDPTLLTRAFELLLRDAARRHGDEPARVSVALSAAGRVVVAQLEDDGPRERAGTDPRAAFAVPSPASAASARTSPMPGLGLVERLVERHGGSLTVGDESSGGTLVRVTLPAADRVRPARREPGRTAARTDGARAAADQGLG